MRGITKGGARLLLVLTIMSAMLLAAAIPSFAQTRRAARVMQSDYIQNVGDARAESGRSAIRGSIGVNNQNVTQDSLSDNLGGGGGASDGVAENVADQGFENIGDAVYDTGASDALGNDASTLIDQLATNDNVSVDDDDDDTMGEGAGSSITQEAIVDNVGTGEAVSGENEATGTSNTSTQNADQIAEAVGDDGSPINDGFNDVVQDVYTDGISDGITGEAIASGNTSTTDIVQTADQIHDDVSAGEDGTGAEVDQIGDVINDGVATATSGRNASTGNYTNSQQNAVQTSTAVSTAAGDEGSLAFTSNRVSSRNAGVGRASLSTGSTLATGNSSTTTVVSSSTNVSTSVDG